MLFQLNKKSRGVYDIDHRMKKGENKISFVHVCSDQCDQFGRNFAMLAKVYGKFVQFSTVLFLFCKILSLLWQICDIIGLFVIVANGQILKNNLTIWSHWP